MKTGRKVLYVLALVTALGTMGAPAQAALRAAGPINPVTTLPAWYQDNLSLALALCLDQQLLPSGANACVLPPNFDPDPTVAGLRTPPNAPLSPITTVGPINDTNFPDESFWWIADAGRLGIGDGTGRVIFRLALEAAFLAAVTPNEGITFLRINLQPMAGLVPGATYTVTHPFGSFTTDPADATGVVPRFRVEDGTLPVPIDAGRTLLPATNTNIGPFLIWDPAVPPAAPVGYIGDPGAEHALINPATGAPATVTITGPNIGGVGVNSIILTDWTLAGKKIGMDVTPFPNATPTAVVGTPVTVPFTVSNITSGAVAFTNPTPLVIAGVDLADFTIINDTCTGATLLATTPPAPPSSCTFGVQFNPAASVVAARKATLTITPADIATAPPVTVNLNGTAQFALTVTAGANGTVTNENGTPAVNENINAGSTKIYKITPTNTLGTTFLPLAMVNNVRQAVAADGTVTIPAIGENKTTAVTFLRAGDLNKSGGIPALDDALRALKISVGIGPAATDEERVAADVGPLVNNAPRANGSVTAGDAFLILRRSLNLDPAW